jgi:hypothetical protein
MAHRTVTIRVHEGEVPVPVLMKPQEGFFQRTFTDEGFKLASGGRTVVTGFRNTADFTYNIYLLAPNGYLVAQALNIPPGATTSAFNGKSAIGIWRASSVQDLFIPPPTMPQFTIPGLVTVGYGAITPSC